MKRSLKKITGFCEVYRRISRRNISNALLKYSLVFTKAIGLSNGLHIQL